MDSTQELSNDEEILKTIRQILIGDEEEDPTYLPQYVIDDLMDDNVEQELLQEVYIFITKN